MSKLRAVDGPMTGMEFPINPAGSMAGRHADCAIPLPDPRASRNHADFRLDSDGMMDIIDLASANGTFVNGIRLPPHTPRQLIGGDEIKIGQNTFRYFSGDSRLPDAEIPGYQMIDVIAEGGMGSICRAKQISTGRFVAVKVLHEHYAEREEFVDRFIQEARAAGRLSHPNIVQVYHVGKTANRHYYFTMELVDGFTLTQRMQSLSIEDIFDIGAAAADALDFAHERGIIHRDIKPDNLMISREGETKLTDLGIALLSDDDAGDQEKRVLGTPHYMSPEQAMGKPLDRRTDVYSLGATLFHALTGEPVFDANALEDVMIQQVRGQPRSIGSLMPQLPKDLCAIIDRCLKKNLGDRFATAGDLRDAIFSAMAKNFPAHSMSCRTPVKSSTGSRKWLLWFGLGALIIAAIIIFFLLKVM